MLLVREATDFFWVQENVMLAAKHNEISELSQVPVREKNDTGFLLRHTIRIDKEKLINIQVRPGFYERRCRRK